MSGAETVDTTTTTVESTTTSHEETHLADGTLLEEMKKAVKQSASFSALSDQKSCLLCSLFCFGALVKKS